MNRLQYALYLTVEMGMFIPLAFFCFVPVIRYAKSTPGRLAIRIAAASLVAEGLFFLLFFLSPTVTASNIGQLALFTGMFILYCREVKLPVIRLLFVFLTACLIGGYSYLIYHLTDILLYPAGSYYMLYKPYSCIAQLVFECTMILVCYFPAKKQLGWMVAHFEEERIWRIVWIFPAVFTFFTYFFVPYNNSYMYLGRLLKMYVVFLILFFVIIFTLYILFYKIALALTEKAELLLRSAYLEVQVQQYQDLQNHIQETRRLRHDFRHQLTVISEMLEHGHYNEAQEYLRKYRADIPQTPRQYCSSTAVNAILYHYNALYQSENIESQFDIRINKDIPVQDIDFCVLLGNLLENALHGCREVPASHRNIELKILQPTPHILVLQIRNPFTGTVTKENGNFLSSKRPGTGQGLNSVRMIAQKYHGEITVTDTDQIFTVQVLLNF